MKNEIGHIMRKYNVLEYKGPGDKQVEPQPAQQSKNLICECRYRGYQEVFRTDRKYEDTAGAE